MSSAALQDILQLSREAFFQQQLQREPEALNVSVSPIINMAAVFFFPQLCRSSWTDAAWRKHDFHPILITPPLFQNWDKCEGGGHIAIVVVLRFEQLCGRADRMKRSVKVTQSHTKDPQTFAQTGLGSWK